MLATVIAMFVVMKLAITLVMMMLTVNTINRGLIHIDPQNDKIIYPEVGGEYQGKEIKEILVASWSELLKLDTLG